MEKNEEKMLYPVFLVDVITHFIQLFVAWQL
jgi:hypothetical protein